MALPVKKVHIDTAHKTADSTSNSSFRFTLAESVTLPDNCVFYVDDVCLPHAWYTIETGLNDRFFISIITNGVPAYEAVTLPSSITNASRVCWRPRRRRRKAFT